MTTRDAAAMTATPCLHAAAARLLSAAELALAVASRRGLPCKRFSLEVGWDGPTVLCADGKATCLPCCDEERR